MSTAQTSPSPARTRRSPQKTAAKAPVTTPAPDDSAEADETVAQATALPIQREKAAAAAAKRDGLITEMSEAWFEMARGSQTATLDALRKVVDVAIPLQGGEESRRRKLIDGAFELADRAGAAPLDMARGAMHNSVLVYFDVDVTVETDVDAFTGVDVDVTVPTTVKTLSL